MGELETGLLSEGADPDVDGNGSINRGSGEGEDKPSPLELDEGIETSTRVYMSM